MRKVDRWGIPQTYKDEIWENYDRIIKWMDEYEKREIKRNVKMDPRADG